MNILMSNCLDCAVVNRGCRLSLNVCLCFWFFSLLKMMDVKEGSVVCLQINL